MLPVGGVEDKQELITLGVTSRLVPRHLVQAVLLLLLIFTKISASDALRFFVFLLFDRFWKSPVPTIYTQISNIGIPHICQAVTIGNTLTPWK